MMLAFIIGRFLAISMLERLFTVFQDAAARLRLWRRAAPLSKDERIAMLLEGAVKTGFALCLALPLCGDGNRCEHAGQLDHRRRWGDYDDGRALALDIHADFDAADGSYCSAARPIGCRISGAAILIIMHTMGDAARAGLMFVTLQLMRQTQHLATACANDPSLSGLAASHVPPYPSGLSALTGEGVC